MNKAVVLIFVMLVIAASGAVFYHLHHRSGSSGPVYHVRTEFEFTVRAPYKVAAPLFGPEGERAWSDGHWDPHFLYPQPAQDIEGAVFQVSHGHRRSTWVNTDFDLNRGHVQYVYFIADVMVTRIDIHLAQPDAANTQVNVVYERTALNPGANDHVREFGDNDRKSGPQWAEDIERHLATQRRE